MLGDPTLVHDFSTDILYEMFEAYRKYRLSKRLSLAHLNKILKTIPVYYYNNKVKRKAYTADFVPVDTVVIVDEEPFVRLYDQFYEQYLDLYCKLDSRESMPDDLRVLFEVLYPTTGFQAFCKGRELSTKTLRLYFVQIKDWTIARFRSAFFAMQHNLAA